MLYPVPIKDQMLTHQNSGEPEKCQKTVLWASWKKQYFHSKSVTLRCDGIVRVAAYAFRHDGVLCHPHTHNRVFPLL
jgi:hypothetical protein